MQTEQMTRLLVKDDKRKSGYKVDGFLLTIADTDNDICGVYYCDEIKPHKTVSDLYQNWTAFHYPMEFDSFELGIKVGDEDWFEGDIMAHKGSSLKDVWVLIYKENKWQIAIKGGQFVTPLTHLSGWKRIGNIHEEGKHE